MNNLNISDLRNLTIVFTNASQRSSFEHTMKREFPNVTAIRPDMRTLRYRDLPEHQMEAIRTIARNFRTERISTH